MSISAALMPRACISFQALSRVPALVAKPGMRVGEDVGPRQAEPVHGARRDHQRLGRVEPAGDADDDPLDAGRLAAACARPCTWML